MRALAQALFDDVPTTTALLAREMRRNGHNGHGMDHAIVLDPVQELPPCSITDAFRKRVVLDQIGNFQVFVGNQIVRCDKRVCRFPGKIFPLPPDLEIRLAEPLAGFFAVG